MANEASTSPDHAQTGSDRNNGCTDWEVEAVPVVQMVLEVVHLPGSRSVEVDRPFQVDAAAVEGAYAWAVPEPVLVEQTFRARDPLTSPQASFVRAVEASSDQVVGSECSFAKLGFHEVAGSLEEGNPLGDPRHAD